jgi:hypothetical protein
VSLLYAITAEVGTDISMRKLTQRGEITGGRIGADQFQQRWNSVLIKCLLTLAVDLVAPSKHH